MILSHRGRSTHEWLDMLLLLPSKHTPLFCLVAAWPTYESSGGSVSEHHIVQAASTGITV